jgi:probable F420-dependent oxidoreductase
MKFGLYGLHRGSSVEPEALARRARLAEDAGFESLWVGDHIAVPGDDPDDDDRLEAVTALSYLAAVTTGVRLCAGVLVLPQRHPVLLAKQLASVDRLSCGRLTVGIGVGHIEAELNALGVTLAGRGARTDEYLAAMRTLWTGQASSYAGEWVQFTSVVERPPPVQQPHPPIVVGGHSGAALRRANRAAAGWFGWDLSLDETTRHVDRLHCMGRECRPSSEPSLEITVLPAGQLDREAVKRYADAGVDRLVLQPTTTGGAAIEDLIAEAAAGLIAAS